MNLGGGAGEVDTLRPVRGILQSRQDCIKSRASLVAQLVEKSTCNARDQGLIPGSGRSSGEENGYPLQYPCWRIPWTEQPDGLQSMGSQRVGHNGETFTFIYCKGRTSQMVRFSQTVL